MEITVLAKPPLDSWKQEAKTGFEPLKAARGPLLAYDKMRAEAKGWCASWHFPPPASCFDESSRVAATLVAQFRDLHGPLPYLVWRVCPMYHGWDCRKVGGHATSEFRWATLHWCNHFFKSLGWDFRENQDVSTTLVLF